MISHDDKRKDDADEKYSDSAASAERGAKTAVQRKVDVVFQTIRRSGILFGGAAFRFCCRSGKIHCGHRAESKLGGQIFFFFSLFDVGTFAGHGVRRFILRVIHFCSVALLSRPYSVGYCGYTCGDILSGLRIWDPRRSFMYRIRFQRTCIFCVGRFCGRILILTGFCLCFAILHGLFVVYVACTVRKSC